MRFFWWTLKLLAGLALVLGLLAIGLAVVFPGLTKHTTSWLITMLVSAALYGLAHVRMGPAATDPAPAEWHGRQFVLPAPWLRQGAACLLFMILSLVIPLDLLRGGPVTRGEGVLVVLGTLLCLWLSRASVLGLIHLRRAGFALKLDEAGLHYPGLPLLPWSQISDVALDPPRPDSERNQDLVLEMFFVPDRPRGLQALWQASLPGASIRRQTVSLPLPMMRDPGQVLAAARALRRRHGG